MYKGQKYISFLLAGHEDVLLTAQDEKVMVFFGKQRIPNGVELWELYLTE